MKLGLSSAAAPDAGMTELVTACVRRGLGVLELRQADRAGVAAADAAGAATARESAAQLNVRIAAYVPDAASGAHEQLAAVSRSLHAPIVVDKVTVAESITSARLILAAGGDAFVLVRGADAAIDAAAVHQAGLSCGWEVHAGATGVLDVGNALLDAVPAALRFIRLVGGGPEAALQGDLGLGALMSRLAISGYAGQIVLTPSSARYRVAWSGWLGRRGSWGCGTKAAASQLVQLESAEQEVAT